VQDAGALADSTISARLESVGAFELARIGAPTLEGLRAFVASGELVLLENAALASLAGLERVVGVDVLQIASNPALPTCEAQRLAVRLGHAPSDVVDNLGEGCFCRERGAQPPRCTRLHATPLPQLLGQGQWIRAQNSAARIGYLFEGNEHATRLAWERQRAAGRARIANRTRRRPSSCVGRASEAAVRGQVPSTASSRRLHRRLLCAVDRADSSRCIHDEQKERDRQRDELLRLRGYEIVRVTNELVLSDAKARSNAVREVMFRLIAPAPKVGAGELRGRG